MTDSIVSDALSQVTAHDIDVALKCLNGIAHRTQILTSHSVNKLTQAEVFFKCENFQRTGSFKFRGAYNALAQLSNEQKQKGVLTFSSGNHAQAVALAGQLLGITTTIVMPKDAPSVKLQATCGYGAEVILYDRAEATREQLAREICEERGLTLIPPYNHPHIIAGQGTTALELIEEVGELDMLLVCCGGGGLLSGCAIATKSRFPDCRIIGVEPEAGDDATRSFHSQTLQTVHNPDTIADGARTPSLGSLTFPLILHYVDDMVTVSDAALLRTLLLLAERLKIVTEPTGVLAAAALLEGIISAQNQRVGVIISGGNVELLRVLQWSQEL